MASNFISTATGVAYELDRIGDAQQIYLNNLSGGELHPARAFYHKPSKYARLEQYLNPESPFAAGGGGTVKFKVKPCNAYWVSAHLHGVVSAVRTTQTDPNLNTNTVAYMDDAWFRLIDTALLGFGCDNNQMKEETGEFWKILYDHHYNSDQRLNKLVNDGSAIERIQWARFQQNFSTPLLFDVFSHMTKALRVLTYSESVPELELRLRTLDDCLEWFGTAIPAGVKDTVNFGPGTIEKLWLKNTWLHVNVKDAAALDSAAPERTIHFRTVCRRAYAHSSATAEQDLPLELKHTLCDMWIVPKNDRYHRTPGAAEIWQIRPFNFSGEPTASGIGTVLRNPFAGAQLLLESEVRFSQSYDELTDFESATKHARNPTDPAEKIAKYHFSFIPMSPWHQAGVQMSQITNQRLTLYWTFNAIAETNWTGEIVLYTRYWNFIKEGQTSAQIVF